MVPGTHSVVLFDAASGQWLAFDRPRQVIEARAAERVLPALRLIEEATSRGQWAAGFISYEAAPGFDPVLQTRPAPAFPLLWFGLYDPPRPVSPPPRRSLRAALAWEPSLGERDYRARFDQVKSFIGRGHTYQVNFSFRLHAPFSGEPWHLFAAMVHAQGGGFPAYLDTGSHVICSASPELFFALDAERLVSSPMKGTADRGLRRVDDERQARRLLESEKNRAENVMIVDMVRNDLGRVARPGTIAVPRLFAPERYPTVWQMTSTVECQTRASVAEILRALFPAASITGAPKVRTMQLIAALENTPRHLYTGAIGYLAPGRRAQFNVAIRTVVLERSTSRAEYGIGGGIVWDSEPQAELDECYSKARVLTQPQPDFALLETLRWSPAEGFVLLEEHLARLRDSALYFSRAVDLDSLRRQLTELARGFPRCPQKVRVLLPANADAAVVALPLDPLPKPYRLRLATRPVHSRDLFLFHKTTHRQVYEAAKAATTGCDDVLLWNERGELTETCIASIALEIKGKWHTPPLEAGLLPGLERARLLAEGKLRETPLRAEDLAAAEKVWLLNSVRGPWEAVFQR
jgi:para-aminobenzoate synthetase / 4-amino-4-deoxychorismate lyase